MDEIKLTDEVYSLKGEVGIIKSDICNIKSDIKNLYETTDISNNKINELNINIVELNGTMKTMNLVFSNSISELNNTVKLLNEEMKSMHDREERRKEEIINEIKENKKSWKNIFFENIKVVSTAIFGGLVALFFWWVKSK